MLMPQRTGRPSDEGQPVEREGWLSQRLDRQPEEQQRVVVTCRPVAVQDSAALAAVDEHPFAVTAHGNRDGLHGRLAVGRPVARIVVDVPAPEAVRAMVPVGRAGRRRGNVQPAMHATEGSDRFQRGISTRRLEVDRPIPRHDRLPDMKKPSSTEDGCGLLRLVSVRPAGTLAEA